MILMMRLSNTENVICWKYVNLEFATKELLCKPVAGSDMKTNINS